MGKIKKQHYVPRFYLKNFAKNENLFVFDKSSNKSFSANIRNVASERYFYDVEEVDKESGIEQTIEKFMQKFEIVGAKAINGLLDSLAQGDSSPLEKNQRMDLSIYLAMQLIRTREARENAIQLYLALQKEDFLVHMKNTKPNISITRENFDLTLDKDKQPILHAQHILNEELRTELAETLFSHYWVILKNCTDQPFYTSDHPIVKKGNVKHPIFELNRIGSLGIEIAYPLSSKYLLVMYEKIAFPQAKKLDGKVSETKNQDNVTHYNALQSWQSYKQIYCEECKFSLIKTIVREEPHITDINYQRLGVESYEYNEKDDPRITFKSLFNQIAKKECFCKNNKCSTKIIKAHSIQNNRILKKIADNGYVLLFNPKDVDLDSSKHSLSKVGRKIATTFTGFCSHHDMTIFQPVEIADYEINNKKQEFLFAYRALAKEYYSKCASLELVKSAIELRNNGKNQANWFIESAERSIKKSQGLREMFNVNLKRECYFKVESDVVVFSIDYPIAISSFFTLDRNFEGKIIHDWQNPKVELKPIFFTMFPQEGKTYCILSYLKKHKNTFSFIKKDICNQNVSKQKQLLSKIIVAYIENFAISPSYWDLFSDKEKDNFLHTFKEYTLIEDINFSNIKETNLFKD